jgi:hypothetical protein
MPSVRTEAFDLYRGRRISTNLPYNFKQDIQPSFNKGEIISTETDFFQRYFGIDLKFFSNVMTPADYNIFVKFIGREKIEIREEDLDIYYPED